jgi:hypothetical protein
MNRGEIEEFVVERVNRTLWLGCRVAVAEREELIATLDEVLADMPARPEAYYEELYPRLRNTLAIAVCVKILVRRGERVTPERLDKIARAVAFAPQYAA